MTMNSKRYRVLSRPGHKLRDHFWLILSVSAVFVLIFVFFTAAHPIVPYDYDDWRYLGQFRSPLPDLSQFNPSRVLPEVSLPLAGYFAAYIVNPFMKDYLASITFTAALAMALFTTILYYMLYRLFLTFSGDKAVSIFVGLLVMCLYFTFFKTNEEGSQYMLYSYNLTTFFYYTIPDLLNTILVCFFMRYAVRGIYISEKEMGRKTVMLLAVALYFAIFSILFAVLVIGVYSFFVLLLRFIPVFITKKEKLTKAELAKIQPMIIVFAGVLAYMGLELMGSRAEVVGETVGYSTFSLEFLIQLRTAFYWFMGLIFQINKAILLVTLGLIFFALGLLGMNMEADRNSALVKTGLVVALCFVSLFPALILIGGKAGPGYLTLTHSTYSIFFYYMLLAALSLIYIISKFKKAAIVLPFFLILLFVEGTNSTVPYMDQSDYADFYFGNPISTRKKLELTNGWIEEIKEADRNGEWDVVIRIPEQTVPDWPINMEDSPELISQALYIHGIISRRINIILETDRQMTEEF